MKRYLACIIVCAALAGCATHNHMGVLASDTSIDTSQKSLVLMTITVAHQNSTARKPKIAVVFLEKPNAQDKADRQNFITDDEGATEQGSATTYELRMALAPGPYTIVAASGTINVFPILANFMIPLQFDINVAPNEVVYLGHIDATLRPFQDGDGFAAGPVLPLLDQAAMGVSTGTFDVSVSDHSLTDLPDFRANFPALQGATIKTEILPPFDRNRATAWSKSTL